jgi:aspartate aminotransferase
MPVANAVKEALGAQSMIRKMFEEGKSLKKQYGDDKVFDFSIGNPDLEPPPAFHRVFLKLAKEDKKGSHGYMPNAGFAEVREALAQKASKEQGVSIDGSHIVMCCGAAGGLNVVLKSILNTGDEVVVPSPYFMEYRPYTANHGGRIVEAATKLDFSLDLDAIREKLSPKQQPFLSIRRITPRAAYTLRKPLPNWRPFWKNTGKNADACLTLSRTSLTANWPMTIKLYPPYSPPITNP